MNIFQRKITRGLLLMLMVALYILNASGQQGPATLRARVVDELGGLIVGAAVTVREASGTEKVVMTNAEGVFVVSGLKPGLYTVRVSAAGFAPYENTEVNVSAGASATLEIKLSVEGKNEEVEIQPDSKLITTNPDDNASATVLRGSDLNVLSDDPDQLAADLQALAGSDGPNGTQLLVDGFSNVRVPSKNSIREVRINANPFTAEQEFFGLGRVEIFTKPGSASFHGQAFLNFNDESLNGRNPYADTRAAYQARLYGGSLSGPIIANKAAFFFDFEQRRINENAIVNATILDDALNIVPFSQTIVTPQKRTNITARFDFQLNPNHTLVARYNYLRSSLENGGAGGFSLPSRVFDTRGHEHIVQLTETAVLGPKMVNELRLQYTRSLTTQEGDATLPTINVQEAFIGGGAPFGLNSVKTDRYEVFNMLTRISGNHTWKAGGRLRRVYTTDTTTTNFAGTFVFSSLEQYRQVSLGVPGARPAQFTLVGGEPQENVGQWDFGAFIQDDWRMRPNFTLSAGLRYEKQTNIGDGINFAPRVSFAWSPWGNNTGKQPKTVIRGGGGIFFGRVGESLRLLANRFNGVNQQQFILRDPDFYPNIPTIAELTNSSQRQTTWRIAENAKMPHTLRLALSIERDLPYKTKLSVNYIYRADRNYPRALNINAPLPGTFDPDVPGSGVFPFGDISNIFEFETTGISNKHTLLINVNSQPHKKLSMFGRFVLSRERSDNETAFSFPANSYDLKAEYGAVSFDIRTNATVGINYSGPWGVAFSSLIRVASANKFNITVGRDINGDAVFTDRPAFATDLSKPGVIVTRFGAFDPNPEPGQQIIPPFYGKGATLFIVSLRASKTINFGSVGGASAIQPGNKPREEVKRFSLTFTTQVQNLFNHTNAGPVIGNLSSPLFGLSNVSATSPRRIDFQLRFGF